MLLVFSFLRNGRRDEDCFASTADELYVLDRRLFSRRFAHRVLVPKTADESIKTCLYRGSDPI